MSNILTDSFDIDIITTTAKDYLTWENVYPEGVFKISDSLRIIRFKAEFKREPYWYELDKIITKNIHLGIFEKLSSQEQKSFIQYTHKLPLGVGEEWIKYNGPYSPDLLQYLSENEDHYNYFIFMTYLFATTYFGIDRIKNTEKIYFVPTYHNEPSAYLPNFLKYNMYHHLFLTNAEKNIAEQFIYSNSVKNNVIGFGIMDRLDEFSANFENINGQYILYAGRLEEGKGLINLFKMFETYSEENRFLKLFLIGEGNLKNYKHKNIIYKGFVSEKEKFSLMKNALAFVHPSAFESLGIVLLESFMMGTPAIVNRKSDVLNEHIINSKAGYSYDNYDEFRDSLNQLIKDKDAYETLSKNARDYFIQNYSIKAYKNRLLNIIR
ncbi:MAG: glycosyltransferase [Spirochaetota bacterium]